MGKKKGKSQNKNKYIKLKAGSVEKILGNALRQIEEKNIQKAIQTIEKGLVAYPNEYRFLLLLGKTLFFSENYEDAALALGAALHLTTDNSEVCFYFARTQELCHRFDQAVIHYAKAIELKPDFLEALTNLGGLSLRLGKLDFAEHYLDRAMRISPNNPTVLTTMGNMHQAQGKFSEAVSCYRKAYEIDPANPIARYNFSRYQPLKESIDLAREVVADDSSLGEPHYSLSLGLLRSCQLKEGWQEYEWRFRKEQKMVPKRPFLLPDWDGAPLPEQSLLIWGEQGLGDEIMFASVFDDALKIAPGAIIECEPRLASLFSRSFKSAKVVPHTDPPHHETQVATLKAQCAAGSLMQWLRTDLDSFKRQKYPFLVPDPKRVDSWSRWLASLGNWKKLGLCWRSMKQGVFRSLGYPSIMECDQLFMGGDILWINLQYDNCLEELKAAKDAFGVEIVQPEGLDLMNDLNDQAALMVALDGVVSAGTATAQLAGAVGARLVMFGTGRPWTQLGTDYLPWYPKASYIFRHSTDQPWQEILRWQTILDLIP